MFRRIFLTAFIAGIVAGLVSGTLHVAKLSPLIAAAETFEMRDHDADHESAAWEPASGWQRPGATLLADMVIACGFGLLLSAGFALREILAGRETDTVQGLLWGFAGFAAFSLAPALGLPPTLPGTAVADLVLRQSWWLGTALATASGLGLIAFGRGPAWRAAGIALLVLPHLVGAPLPAADAAGPSAQLGARFAAASLVIAAIFWAVLGSLGGWTYQRLGRAT
ncbi:MAG TPA: CbtA family protein [Stellaceae bacterium]|nr:CbtA family protein [Stellaceae bacterium]